MLTDIFRYIFRYILLMIKLIKRKRYFRQNISIFETVYTMQKLHKNR